MAARVGRLVVVLTLGVVLPASAAAAVVRPPTSQEIAASPVPARGADPVYARSYFGARYYRADVARFTTVDPVLDQQATLADPQRWNRYAYARNNPLKYVDPDGRDIAAIVLEFTGMGKRLTYVDTRVYDNLQNLLTDAAKEGVTFTFNSVFREEGRQVQTPFTVNRTGTSPHLVGLAFDIQYDQIKGGDLAKVTGLAAKHGFHPLRNQEDDPPHFQANEFITRDRRGRVDAAYRDMLALNQRQYRFYESLRSAMLQPLPLAVGSAPPR